MILSPERHFPAFNDNEMDDIDEIIKLPGTYI